MEGNKLCDKKINFEALTKDELINKCKSFLSIIQKAKKSKDVLQEEVELLKANLHFVVEKKEMEPAVKELIENLTQQKLTLVSNLQDLRLKNDALFTNLNQCKEEKGRIEVELNNIDIENIALKKQITRLTDDNEQLINHLESLEKQIKQLNNIGLDQQKQLLQLEEKNRLQNISGSTKDHEKIQDLEKMLSISLNEIKKMKSETNKDSDLMILNNKFKEKLKNYHSKIIKLAIHIKALKNDKEIILNQFKTYVDQVRDWKDKLDIASNNLLSHLTQFENKNDKLIRENLHLKYLNDQFIKQLEAHKTDDEKSKEIEEIQDLEKQNSMLKNEVLILKNRLEECTLQDNQDENIDLQKKIEQLTEENNLKSEKLKQGLESNGVLLKQWEVEKEDLHKDLIEERNKLKQYIVMSNEKIDQLNQQIANFQEIIGRYDFEKLTINEEMTKLKDSLRSQKLNIEDLERRNINLVSELQNSLATEKQLAEKSGEELLKLVKEIEVLTNNNMELKESIQEFKHMEEQMRCKVLVNADIQTENEFKPPLELEEQIMLLKSENSQLLAEMNEMNQELKERGENVSKLGAHCEEIKKKIRIYETQANSNVNNITEKEEKIRELNSEVAEKEQIIASLKNNIELLRERNSNSDTINCVEFDIMSTSTISRTEEMERLKDLEGSWEEKYGKLKNLAIKLKAKLREQITEVNTEKTEKAELLQKLNNAYENLKVLQSQYDNLSDEIDEVKKKYNDYSNIVSAHEEIIKKKDNSISEMQSKILNLEKEKTATEKWKKQISIKVQALRKELEEKEASTQDSEMKLLSLKSDLEAKEQALKLERENLKKTKNSLQHFTNENKKHSVLNLEMQDYEKSVKDLSLKLEKKNEEVIKLKEQIDFQKIENSTLVNQQNILQEKIEYYQTTLDSVINEKNAYAKKLSEIECILLKKEENISSLYRQLEIIRLQNEELSTSLSNDIAERQKMINSLKEEKETLYVQSLNLLQNNGDLQQKLSLTEEELLTVSQEFENYKIRAQSVLRQHQNRDISLEEKLNGNVCSLLSQIQVLNSEIDQLENSRKLLESSNETLKLKHSSLILNHGNLSADMKDLKEQFEILQLKYDQSVNEHKDTVRSLKVHAETLSQCYRQQLSEQEVRHNREIIELQSRIEKTQTPAEILLPSFPSMTREEGEGSESADSVNNLPVPLEKLLCEDDEHKVNILKKQINEQESKLHHLTELLADTEQDLAKHIQMNNVLKEEIRRQQRAVEREKHAENLEYLKNVVLKFITLHNGDERSRLVPVLNTILKLSPEETRKLDMVTKGDPGLRAWSSYLPAWSSSNKS